MTHHDAQATLKVLSWMEMTLSENASLELTTYKLYQRTKNNLVRFPCEMLCSMAVKRDTVKFVKPWKRYLS